MNETLRGLPSVDEVLARPVFAQAPRAALKAAVRAAIAETRARLLRGEEAEVTDARVHELLARELRPRLRRVWNATGVVLHTNLGRAPLHEDALAQVAAVAGGYSNLEFDLERGGRGHRGAHVDALLRELFGAEASHAVNNCAGATLLALTALGRGKRAVISRGELVEIGGGFRVPEILALSGSELVEVGTTNRTHLADYERALSPGSILLRVHRSNFALQGFVSEPKLADLARLAHARSSLFLHDLGSGALDARLGETTAAQSLRDGADLVMISGDKLLGAGQAGILLGSAACIDACRVHALSRALRIDRMALAALEATLRLYRDGRADELPSLRAIFAPPELLRARCEALVLALGQGEIVPTLGRVGGGSLPLRDLPGFGVRLSVSPAALRAQGIVALFREGEAVLDLRCIERPDELLPPLREALLRRIEGESATLDEGEAEV